MYFIARQALVALILVPGVGACAAGDYSRRAERSAQRILAAREGAVLGGREASALEPTLRPPAPATPLDAEEPPQPFIQGQAGAPLARVLTLRQALAIAYQSSRDMLTRREELRLDALSLSGTRRDFAPQLALTLSYLFDEAVGLPDSNQGTASFSASQILATGATLALDASSNALGSESSGPGYDSFVTLSLAQPLLRGGGYGVTHEALIQAERSLVYAIREFELFREDFSIEVARRFYDLVNQKQSIDNQRRNLESNEFGRRQAEALFAVGQASELDVLRARRSELTARNTLLEAEENVQLAHDNFRIFLGLPPSEPIDVQPDPPAFTTVEYEMASAIAVAMENRLDLLNRKEQLEDVERGLRLAANGLLPDLDLTFSSSLATTQSNSLGGDDFGRTDTSLALSLGLPLDRVRQRNAYRSAEIALGRARRGLEEFEDQMRVSIQRAFRELARRLESLGIQRQLITDQTKNLRIAELRFERGELPNRDVVEAKQSLLEAQNNLIDEQVSYEIARLQLLRDLGLLFVDDTGMWKR